jgi:tRNA G18 (ribose-2'-O)-methylase SpoU
LIDTILHLKKNYSFKIISAEISEKSININKFSFPEKFCLVFGSEGNGISPEILKISDYIVKIPISPDVISLNVATSSGIFLYNIKK